jgi:hypothetical protein
MRSPKNYLLNNNPIKLSIDLTKITMPFFWVGR